MAFINRFGWGLDRVLGMPILDEFIFDDEEFEEDSLAHKRTLFAPPRSDGKELCKWLRMSRLNLAKMNNISYYTPECKWDGPCGGTCVKCDMELKYLMDELEKIPVEKRKIPNITIPIKLRKQYDFELHDSFLDRPLILGEAISPYNENPRNRKKKKKRRDWLDE